MTTRKLTLGRHVEHDIRSRAFSAAIHPAPLESRSWAHAGPMLDQDALGACTGYACAGDMNCAPFVALRQGKLVSGDDAIDLYKHATRLDKIPGHYPPDDTGSSGLGVAKAAVRAGLAARFAHAFSLDSALHALQRSALLSGFNWYEGFDEPIGDAGELQISGAVRGGHEVCINGLDLAARRVFGFSSWGPDWGRPRTDFGPVVGGGFSMSFDTWARLLSEQGDVTELLA